MRWFVSRLNSRVLRGKLLFPLELIFADIYQLSSLFETAVSFPSLSSTNINSPQSDEDKLFPDECLCFPGRRLFLPLCFPSSCSRFAIVTNLMTNSKLFYGNKLPSEQDKPARDQLSSGLAAHSPLSIIFAQFLTTLFVIFYILYCLLQLLRVAIFR